MRIQSINSNGNISSKGNMPKLSKLTNLAYSALFTASLIPAVDAFIPSKQAEKTKEIETEIKAQYVYEDERLQEIIDKLEEMNRQDKINAYKEYVREKREEEIRDDVGTGLYGFDFLKIIGGGLIIGWLAGNLTNEIRNN